MTYKRQISNVTDSSGTETDGARPPAAVEPSSSMEQEISRGVDLKLYVQAPSDIGSNLSPRKGEQQCPASTHLLAAAHAMGRNRFAAAPPPQTQSSSASSASTSRRTQSVSTDDADFDVRSFAISERRDAPLPEDLLSENNAAAQTFTSDEEGAPARGGPEATPRSPFGSPPSLRAGSKSLGPGILETLMTTTQAGSGGRSAVQSPPSPGGGESSVASPTPVALADGELGAAGSPLPPPKKSFSMVASHGAGGGPAATPPLLLQQQSTATPHRCESPALGPPLCSGADGESTQRSLPGGYDCPLVPATTAVVVIGAGPAGLALGILLARAQVDFVILDHSRPSYAGVAGAEEAGFPGGGAAAAVHLPSHGMILNAQSLDVLHQLDALEAVTMEGRPLQGASVLHNDSVVAKHGTGPRAGGGSTTRFRSGIVIEQWRLERILEARLLQEMDANKRGTLLRYHVAFKVVIKIAAPPRSDCGGSATGSTDCLRRPPSHDYRVKVLIRQMDPEARRPKTTASDDSGMPAGGKWLKAKYVVGADGVRSITRRALEIESLSYGTPYEYLTADIDVAEWGNNLLNQCHAGEVCSTAGRSPQHPPENQLFIVHRPSGSGILVPYARSNRWRLIVRRAPATAEALLADPLSAPKPPASAEPVRTTTPVPLPPPVSAARGGVTTSSNPRAAYGFMRLPTPGDHEIQAIVKTLVPNTTIRAVGCRTAYYAEYRRSSQTVKERGILIGDAARLHSPLWAGGVNQALFDAYALAWRLVAVAEDRASEELLYSYSDESGAYTEALIESTLGGRDRLLDYEAVTEAVASAATPGGAVFQKLKSLVAKNTEQDESRIQAPFTMDAMREAISDIVLPPAALTKHTTFIDKGVSTGGVRVLAFAINDEGSTPRVIPLSSLCRSPQRHVMLLLVHLLERGTRQRTIFGCQRNELAPRYDRRGVEALLRVARSVAGSCLASSRGPAAGDPDPRHSPPPLCAAGGGSLLPIKPVHSAGAAAIAETQEPGSGIRFVWVFCGLTDPQAVRNRSATLSHQQLVRQIPAKLRTLVTSEPGLPRQVYTVIDHECMVTRQLDLNLEASSLVTWPGVPGLLSRMGLCGSEAVGAAETPAGGVGASSPNETGGGAEEVSPTGGGAGESDGGERSAAACSKAAVSGGEPIRSTAFALLRPDGRVVASGFPDSDVDLELLERYEALFSHV